jgi:hypothetical protein
MHTFHDIPNIIKICDGKMDEIKIFFKVKIYNKILNKILKCLLLDSYDNLISTIFTVNKSTAETSKNSKDFKIQRNIKNHKNIR